MYLANQKNSINEALRDFDQALKINPNYVQVYFQKSIICAWVFNDYVEAIKNREIAVRIDHSTFMSGSLRSLGDLYSQAGFKDLARNYYHKAFQLDNDSVTFYNYISWQNFSEENISGAREWALSAYHLDTASIWSVMQLVMYNSYLGNNEEANRYAVKLVELFETFQMALPGDWHRIGYTFWKLGKTKEADHYFNEQIKWCEESIRLNKPYAETYGAHYDLACVLSLKGKTERAMELLYELNNKKFWPKWVISQFKYEPFFESIRDDARFKKIFQDINSKYQREHDRVKVWLNQEGLL
jgi:tetratricopeptide (TPR) repeat protein